jgi:tetratricopeptide (TPR) repeat protein
VTSVFQPAQILRQIETLLRAGSLPQAMRLAREATARGIVQHNVLVLAALYEIEAGAPANALEIATRARELKPRSGEGMLVLGIALAGVGRHRDAIAAYEESLRYQPGVANVHFNKGMCLEEIHEWTRAQREYERALDIDPRHAESLAHLASLAASQGDTRKARDYAQRALNLKPGQPAAAIALAQLDLNAGNFDAVRSGVAPLLGRPGISPINRALAEALSGDALDGAGKYAEAFAHYAQANAIFKDHHRREFEAPGAERALARARRIAAWLRGTDLARWRNCDAGSYRSPVHTHVFLVGFPRSGTTLLEQVLASHAGIEALEERDCLAAGMAEFILPPDGLDRLAALEGDSLSRFRDAYWAEARAGGARLDGQVFIDKLPLNALNLPMIAKFFPSAKVLLALRDPRDVILSCFRKRFRMSPSMYELLSLDTAAHYYAATMDICEISRREFTLATFESRYEDLVGEFEPRVRALCAFLGVEYDEAMRDFAERTRGRMIMTPSAAQVARGLYQSGKEQWRAYARNLAPVMAVLAPWIGKLGYGTD